MNKMIITLQILASDILATDYTVSQDCAITRALARAGYPTFKDCGTDIVNSANDEVIVTSENETYDALAMKVVKMYRYKRNPKATSSTPIEDFEHVLEI